MFHQIIFFVILICVMILAVASSSRMYYHLLFKRDYEEWASQSKNTYQDLRTLLGERRFKLIMAAFYGLISLFTIFLFVALVQLSRSFDLPILTHLATTALLLTILANIMAMFIYPIPGVTEVKLEKPKVAIDITVTGATYCCLIAMLILAIIEVLK